MIEQIVMLRSASPKTCKSSYRNRERKGPYRPRAVTPTPSHGEQKRAADSFNPLPDYAGSSSNTDGNQMTEMEYRRKIKAPEGDS